MSRRAPLILSVLVVCLASAPAGGAEPRPAAWAAPVALEGAPNLHRVTDTLYRGAQPTAAGMRAVKQLGVKTVVNLRAFHSDAELIADSGLVSVEIPMTAWRPKEEEAAFFLRTVTDPQRGPYLVHCQHGADRTGAMIAIYRMAAQGWTKEEALREMREGGFGYHSAWVNLPAWLEKLDIEKLRKRAGLPNPPAGQPHPPTPSP